MSDLSPDREIELQRALSRKLDEWRIAEELGLPISEPQKIWDTVWLEMKFHCADYGRAMSIASHARRWIETRNPSHIDAAVHLCSIAKIRPPPKLAELIADIARRRLFGDLPVGKPAKLAKEAAKDHALTMMTNLCAAGLTIEAAASKAAARLKDSQFSATFTASSLDKLYTRRWRELERERRAYWATDEGAEQLQEWLLIIPHLPDTPYDERGERR